MSTTPTMAQSRRNRLHYAAELRSAAGLPPRGHDAKWQPVTANQHQTGALSQLQENLAASWNKFVQSPGVQTLNKIMKPLAPLWWMFRGWAVFAILLTIWTNYSNGGHVHVLPVFPSHWVGLVLCILLSVMWGQGKWMDQRVLPTLSKVVSIIVVLAIPFLATAVQADNVRTLDHEWLSEVSNSSVVYRGNSVPDIFAYDCSGALVEGVRLYDAHQTFLPSAERYFWTAENGEFHSNIPQVEAPYTSIDPLPNAEWCSSDSTKTVETQVEEELSTEE